MTQRIDAMKQSSELFKKFVAFSKALEKSSIEPSIVDLVHIRASQINGCAFCLDMHVKEAKIRGERELRLHHLAAWRESTLFVPRERAALAWTEAVTQLSEYGAPDDLYEELLEHFTEVEVVDLTMTIATINAWNRMAVSFRPPVGDYQPGPVATVTSPSPA